MKCEFNCVRNKDTSKYDSNNNTISMLWFSSVIAGNIWQVFFSLHMHTYMQTNVWKTVRIYCKFSFVCWCSLYIFHSHRTTQMLIQKQTENFKVENMWKTHTCWENCGNWFLSSVLLLLFYYSMCACVERDAHSVLLHRQTKLSLFFELENWGLFFRLL